MWNKKLYLSTSTQYGIGIAEQIKLFGKVGFDAFSPSEKMAQR